MASFFARTQEGEFPQLATVNDMEFVVYEGVFSPEAYLDARFFSSHLLELVTSGASLLEVGCGSGAIAVILACSGVQVTAVDIDEVAVANATANAERHGVTIRAACSDVFAGVGTGTYDFVFWNVPFGIDASRSDSALYRPVLDPQYASIGRYVGQVHEHLASGGTALLGFSTTLGEFDSLEDICASSGYSLEVVAETTDDYGDSLELLRLVSPGGDTRSSGR